MRLVWLVIVVMLLASATEAQTATPTATPTVTPTDDIYQVWMLPAATNDLGTAIPAQPVAFIYEVNAGDVMITILGMVLVFVLWGTFGIWLLMIRRRNGGGG